MSSRRETGGGPEEMAATPTAAEGSEEMEITYTGRRTQLELSKHAVNVHDRTPAQPKNTPKHAPADPERAADGRTSGTPKASAPPLTERKTGDLSKPTPGLGAIRQLKPTYAQAATAPMQNTTTKEAGWNVMGPKGKVQKQLASGLEDWLLPLKERSNPEDDRKVIFPRDGVTPHPGGNIGAITTEINRALRPDHIRLWTLHRNAKGVLTALTRKDCNARQFLYFKDIILIAARNADPGIINVQSNET
jgi:hypothetical protein